ncbi:MULTISPECIES: rhomboid family intramembrane serine protease [Cellulophaga]|uniref:Peptidase S54, rhomboid domain protein n=2 Tax=Cellulophaga TaxID=104264 RepID=F0RH53_CELLC|nr:MULTISPECIES: rhomboid family intramembrane serine protease [Cellulophaga]ADY28091.1 Peptidase S54, rhomboid domain protein [Cellulophaga lytica DSM 7489]AIM59166.1 protease [Cellulophaga lytica]APU08973.1 rhomboid family intramembrane serine protease [Cellulophaga lytica]EWH14247.1 peptidase S54, rhomboid domain-containing protein [Cellulophaga geojensis KL-A]MDO6855165.1 rhomboid family intramembrane serine protease [Cellulophaga lytica]
MGRLTDVIKHLIIINVIFFLATQTLGDQMYQWFSLWFPENENFQLWQLVSHMFMHGGFMHIAFNMYALYAFGTPLEQMWGKNKFLFFYFSAGIGAALIHTGVNYFYFNQGLDAIVNSGVSKEQVMGIVAEGKYMPDWYNVASKSTIDNFLSAYNTPAVGASGAIYGILVAFGMMFPNAELMMIFLPIPIKAKYFIPVLIGIDLFSGLTGYSLFGGGIAHFAHIGGAIFGFIMMWYWKKNQFNNNRWN